MDTEANTDWLLTGRVRSGWVYSTGFLYLTGGLAVNRLTAATRYVDTVTLGNPSGFRISSVSSTASFFRRVRSERSRSPAARSAARRMRTTLST